MHLLSPFTLLLPFLLLNIASSNASRVLPRGQMFSLSNGPKHLPPNAPPPNQPLPSLTPSSNRQKSPPRSYRIKCHGRFELSCQQKCYCTPQNTVFCNQHSDAEIDRTMREEGHSRKIASMVVNLNMQNTMALCTPSCYCGVGPFKFTSEDMRVRWENVQRL
ncbi:hypothetical protein MMC30_006733 [Trapelia coarctata]|nr:hypothetical protein [Trapelia coarctata]